MTVFYNDIKKLIADKSFNDAKDKLLTFFSENKADPIAVNLYLECLLALSQFEDLHEYPITLYQKRVKSSTMQAQPIISLKNVFSGTLSNDIPAGIPFVNPPAIY